MDEDLLKNGKKFPDMMRERIMKGISNADEVLKSEEQEQFEERVRKGEVDVATIEELDNEYGGRFWKGEDIDAVKAECDSIIEKGETEEISEDEYEFATSNLTRMKGLIEKAMPVPTEEGHYYQRIFVEPQGNSEENA